MTEEELKKNIDAGREWLEANEFYEDIVHENGYFHKAVWANDWLGTVTIQEPDAEHAKSIIASGAEDDLDIWLCFVKFGLETDPDRTCTWGTTPKEALERSLKEYDEEMAERRKYRFKAILDKEPER